MANRVELLRCCWPQRWKHPQGNCICTISFLGHVRSIEQFVKAFKAKNLPLHVLVNNAGLQAPYDDTTDEGFEVRGLRFPNATFDRLLWSAQHPWRLVDHCASHCLQSFLALTAGTDAICS